MRRLPAHPLANKQGHVLEHRRICWEYNGPFPIEWAVHHINHDVSDNRPENLRAMPRLEHLRHHYAERERHDTVDLVEAYRSGMSLPEIAAAFGINTGNAWRKLQKHGVQTRSARKFSDDEEAQIAEELRDAGYAIPVMERWGCNRAMITKIQRAHGIRLRVGRPPGT